MALLRFRFFSTLNESRDRELAAEILVDYFLRVNSFWSLDASISNIMDLLLEKDFLLVEF